MSRLPFHIRAATPADIGAITRIYGDEVAHGVASLEEAPPPESEMAARMAKITGLGLPYLVAENAGRVLGYSYAGPFHTRSAYRFTLEDTIYIDRDARGLGVGRALVEALLVAAEQIGCRQMMALISFVDDSVSVRLHEKLGFRPLGIATAVGYKFGRWIDVMYMQRRIGGGDATPPDRAAPGR
jgi:phosphinothricin acetyltransferase